MTKFRIVLDREACIGCGACSNICPSYWRLDNDKATIIGGRRFSKEGREFEVLETEVLDCDKDVVAVCPTGAIRIEELRGDI